MKLQRTIYDFFRLTLGIVFLSSGIGKFYGTSGLIGPGYMFNELAKHNLLAFAIFIALAEIIIGYLLIIKKYSTLGAVMLVPMIANILVIVLSLDWQGTPLIDGVFLMMNLYLLWFDRKKLLPLLGINTMWELGKIFTTTLIYHLGLLLIIAGVSLSYIFDNMLFKYLTRSGLLIILGKSIYELYKNKRAAQDN